MIIIILLLDCGYVYYEVAIPVFVSELNEQFNLLPNPISPTVNNARLITSWAFYFLYD